MSGTITWGQFPEVEILNIFACRRGYFLLIIVTFDIIMIETYKNAMHIKNSDCSLFRCLFVLTLNIPVSLREGRIRVRLG